MLFIVLILSTTDISWYFSHLYILLFLAVGIMSSSVYSISALVSQLDRVRLKLHCSHLGSKLTTGCFPYFLPYYNKYQLCHIENVGHKMFYTDGLKIIYCTKWFLGKYFTWDASLHVKEINLFNIMFFVYDNRSIMLTPYQNILVWH